jgi:hypothetical protein
VDRQPYPRYPSGRKDRPQRSTSPSLASYLYESCSLTVHSLLSNGRTCSTSPDLSTLPRKPSSPSLEISVRLASVSSFLRLSPNFIRSMSQPTIPLTKTFPSFFLSIPTSACLTAESAQTMSWAMSQKGGSGGQGGGGQGGGRGGNRGGNQKGGRQNDKEPAAVEAK